MAEETKPRKATKNENLYLEKMENSIRKSHLTAKLLLLLTVPLFTMSILFLLQFKDSNRLLRDYGSGQRDRVQT